MNSNTFNLLELLDYIDPSTLSYTEWLNVGMVLHDEGYSCDIWDRWSSKDTKRYRGKSGECFRKWDSFQGATSPVTAGTIVQLAKDQGWRPERGHKDSYELDWDAVIGGKGELVIIDKHWVEGREVAEPEKWNPAGELVRYLEILFEASENVGYVTESLS